MAIYVNTNVSSLNGMRNLNNVQNSLNTTYQRLSSGLRINSAKDDAAGLQISDRLTTQINGLNQGNRNAADGIALAQTMEGGMDEISNMLQKIRTLAVQSANGTNTQDDRVAMSKEARALTSEISRIARQTKFGGKQILDGAAGGGAKAEKDAAPAANTTIFGSAGTLSYLNKNVTGGGAIKFQVGANSGDSITLNIGSFVMSKLMDAAQVVAAEKGKVNGGVSANKSDINFMLSDASGASASIKSLDAMIAYVDSQRADLGAMQNRLESSIRNQSNVATNQSDARARIRDADFAEESANLSQQNIIQQAATSMLMQANSRPQLALSMLG